MSGFTAAVKAVDWPKDSENAIFTSMKREFLRYCFQVNGQRQNTSEHTAVMCCFLTFGSGLQTKYRKNINKPLKKKTTKYTSLSLQMKNINRKF